MVPLRARHLGIRCSGVEGHAGKRVPLSATRQSAPAAVGTLLILRKVRMAFGRGSDSRCRARPAPIFLGIPERSSAGSEREVPNLKAAGSSPAVQASFDGECLVPVAHSRGPANDAGAPGLAFGKALRRAVEYIPQSPAGAIRAGFLLRG